MSVRYSGSPTLHLRIGESRLRGILHGTLCLICAYALYPLCDRGYAALGLLLAPIVIFLLCSLRRDPFVAALLCWSQGVWTLEQQGVRRVIAPTARSTVMPWMIYLAFTDIPRGSTCHMWLYADSAAPAQLRRLRVRLTLERNMPP